MSVGVKAAIISGIFLLASAIYATHQQPSETNSASSSNQTGGITAGKLIVNNPPAQYSISKTIKLISTGLYRINVRIWSNQNVNLPQHLCLIIKPDAKITSRVWMLNTYQRLTPVQSDGKTYGCIQNPSNDITAQFEFEHDPSTLDLSLDY